MKNILNKPVDIKLALALYVMLLVLGTIMIGITSCKTTKQIAAENERRRQEHIALLEETRKEHPCDTFRTYSIDTVLQFAQGDTVRIGEIIYIQDTVFIKRTVTKFVLDSAWLQQYRDSLASTNYAFDIAREDAVAQSKRADKAETLLKTEKDNTNYWRRIILIGGGILAALIGAGIVIKLTKII
jgi:hypothetical protein